MSFKPGEEFEQRLVEGHARSLTDRDRRIEELIAERDKAVAERDEAQKWMRFIADTQHRFLDTFRIELSDDEWRAFAEALGIDPGGDAPG